MSENTRARAHAMALEIALVTLIRLQSEEVKSAFMAAFRKNVSMFQDGAIATTHTDEWIAALKTSADALLSLAGESGPKDGGA